MNEHFCLVLVKAHVLTGNDVTSRNCTKLAAMQYNTIVYLTEFVERAEQSRPTSCGFGRVRHLSHRQIRFIIAFLGPYSCLCSHCHIQKAPASSVVCRHVTRAFLLCSRGYSHEGRRLDCCQCGCESDRGALKPLKCLNSLFTNML